MQSCLSLVSKAPKKAALAVLLPALLFLAASGVSAQAQSADDTTLFEVTDVAVDITSDSAAKARNEAIAQAQRNALEQLLGRLGAEASLAAKADDNTVAALVQSFEVQNERTSPVRYIGTFTVRFRPVATRQWLNQNGASFTETRSKSILILPVYDANGHPVLWEDHTKWWAAWEGSHNSGLVPIVVPSGSLDDIAVLSTEEAVQGDGDAIKNLIDKYQADGAVVAVLSGDLVNPGQPYNIQVTRYDADGTAAVPVSITLSAAGDKNAIDNALAQGVQQVRAMLEGTWRQIVAKSEKTPAARLPVVVPIDSIAEWNTIKHKLDKVPTIDRVDIITLARGTTSIEIEYHGDIEQLQDSLAQQNLALTQDEGTGSWVLQQVSAQGF
jgi:hypothetical protein